MKLNRLCDERGAFDGKHKEIDEIEEYIFEGLNSIVNSFTRAEEIGGIRRNHGVEVEEGLHFLRTRPIPSKFHQSLCKEY